MRSAPKHGYPKCQVLAIPQLSSFRGFLIIWDLRENWFKPLSIPHIVSSSVGLGGEHMFPSCLWLHFCWFSKSTICSHRRQLLSLFLDHDFLSSSCLPSSLQRSSLLTVWARGKNSIAQQHRKHVENEFHFPVLVSSGCSLRLPLCYRTLTLGSIPKASCLLVTHGKGLFSQAMRLNGVRGGNLALFVARIYFTAPKVCQIFLWSKEEKLKANTRSLRG